MKKNLIYVAPLVALILGGVLTGCLKTKENTPAPVPSGKFGGQFRVIRKKATGPGFDTIIRTTTFKLNMKADSGYKVVGDTTKHAGSHGTYSNNDYYIQFNDVTYSETDTSKKKHLVGVYRFYYDGDILQMVRSYSDTLSYQYDLKKTAN